jgi:hypothetical protein
MVALVLWCFGGRKVHLGGTVITTISDGGVTRRMGSRRSCLGSGWVAIIGVVRKGSVGLDSVVKFHRQFHKFVEIPRLIGLVNETGFEFLGKPSFVSGLLLIGVAIQKCH